MKIFGYEMSKDAINLIIIYSGAHWDNVPLCPEEIVPICPSCSYLLLKE